MSLKAGFGCCGVASAVARGWDDVVGYHLVGAFVLGALFWCVRRLQYAGGYLRAITMHECVRCGYSLRTFGDPYRCPECGYVNDSARLAKLAAKHAPVGRPPQE